VLMTARLCRLTPEAAAQSGTQVLMLQWLNHSVQLSLSHHATRKTPKQGLRNTTQLSIRKLACLEMTNQLPVLSIHLRFWIRPTGRVLISTGCNRRHRISTATSNPRVVRLQQSRIPSTVGYLRLSMVIALYTVAPEFSSSPAL